MFRQRRTPHSLTLFALLSLIAGSLALASCGKDDNPTNPGGGGGGATSTTYKGTISGSTTSGELTLTVSTGSPAPAVGSRARAVVTASGTLELDGGGGTVILAGSYDNASHVLGAAGGGWSFAGGKTADGLEGNFSGPGGVSGVFSCQTQGSGTDTVIVVTGNFTSTSGGSNGTFNFSIRGGVLHGNAVDDGDTVIPLDGTYSAGNDSIKVVHPANPTGPPLAWGKLQSNGSASGLFDDQAGNSGDWSGNRH